MGNQNGPVSYTVCTSGTNLWYCLYCYSCTAEKSPPPTMVCQKIVRFSLPNFALKYIRYSCSSMCYHDLFQIIKIGDIIAIDKYSVTFLSNEQRINDVYTNGHISSHSPCGIIVVRSFHIAFGFPIYSAFWDVCNCIRLVVYIRTVDLNFVYFKIEYAVVVKKVLM